LTADEQARFEEGLDEFLDVETPATGLGPVFNEASCASCHAEPATGGSGPTIETRFGLSQDGSFDPLVGLGGSLLQSRAIAGCPFGGEQVPPQANVVAGRRTTPLFGLGLVDAVPDQAFHDRAAAEARDPDRAFGRVAVVRDAVTGRLAVGKFGWKAQIDSLFVFGAEAYLNEMGITNPLFPNENCPQGNCALLACDPVADPEDDGTDVERFNDFMTMLAPPPQARRTGNARAGENTFSQIGCATCHQPDMTTGSTSPIAALRDVTFHPYSDFLLHDMGALADGIAQGAARTTEMRTAPLWGVSRQRAFLHDGRAATLTDAILAHDGQGRPSRDRFAALPEARKRQLLAFLNAI
jgi:CxxC motif-containing protein (DUF1111 family)